MTLYDSMIGCLNCQPVYYYKTCVVQILKITFGRRVVDKATGDRSLVKAVIMVVLLPPSAMDLGSFSSSLT